MKFKIVTNANTDWKKRRKPKRPKTEKSIPDGDLCMNNGKTFDQMTKAEDEYHYQGKPYGVDAPHV